VLRRAGFIVVLVFCSFLGACGTPPKTVTIPDSEVSVSGLWRDTSFVLESCGVQGSFGLELDLVQTGQRVAGSSLLEFVDGGTSETTSFTGTFEGTALTGTTFYPIRNSSGEVTSSLKFDFTLKYQNGILSGEMRSAEFTCANQTVGQMQSSLKLITASVTPVSPDALEPNNLPSQAKPVTNGETLKNLTLGQGDVDWYTFTVAENSQATVLLELLTEFPVAITLFDESELLGIYESQAPKGELQAQVNTLDVTVAMTAGKYYIAVSEVDDTEFTGNHTVNGKYELSLSTRTVPLDDNEFNNSPETATKINLDYATKELSLYKGDRDWFTFTLTEARKVRIDVSGTKDDFIYELYQSDAITQIFQRYQSYEAVQEPTLQAGTYYLKIYNSFGDIRYPLVVTSQAVPDAALEPNDTRETARSITPEFSATLFLSPTDEDWFTFTLTESRLVTFDVAQFGAYNVMVQSDNQLVHQFYEAEPKTLLLAAGKYDLRFYNTVAPVIKTIRLSSQVLVDGGLEPNNIRDRATSVPFPYQQQGYLYEGDVDWYALTLPESKQVTIDFSGGGLEFLASLYYSNWSPVFERSQVKVQRRILGAGTYYLELNSPSFPVYYSLGVTLTDVPDKALEPNDDFNHAREITFPFSQQLALTASLMAQDDDWFNFTLPAKQLVTVAIKDDVQARLEGVFYTSRGQQYDSFSTDNGGKLYTFVLEAGTHYLKLSPRSYDGIIFELSLQAEAIPDTRYEPNDTQGQAYIIPLGFSNSNLLVTYTDADFYTFSLSETTQVVIRTVGVSGFINATLFDAVGNYIDWAGSSEPILQAGSYIIGVSSNDRAVKYSLSIAKK
jgi:hypothetical protein